MGGSFCNYKPIEFAGNFKEAPCFSQCLLFFYSVMSKYGRLALCVNLFDVGYNHHRHNLTVQKVAPVHANIL